MKNFPKSVIQLSKIRFHPIDIIIIRINEKYNYANVINKINNARNCRMYNKLNKKEKYTHDLKWNCLFYAFSNIPIFFLFKSMKNMQKSIVYTIPSLVRSGLKREIKDCHQNVFWILICATFLYVFIWLYWLIRISWYCLPWP